MNTPNTSKDENISQDKILLFIKIGKKEHIERLVQAGEIYMNSTSYFKKIENKEIGDDYEGIFHLMQTGKISISDISDKPEWIPLFDGKGKQSVDLRFSSIKQPGNLFCMYAFNIGLLDKQHKGYFYHIIPTEVTNGFGDTICIIHNPNEFINRIQKALQEKGHPSTHRMVEYYDEKSYDGKVTPFMKRKTYSHQNEYRVFCENELNEPIQLSLGSLEDIAIIKKEPMLQFTFESGTKAFLFISKKEIDIEAVLANVSPI